MEYHKANFKKKMCNQKVCNRKEICPFVHDKNELNEEKQKTKCKALSMANSIGSKSTKNFSFSHDENKNKSYDPYGLFGRQLSGYLNSPQKKDSSCGFSLKRDSLNYNCFSHSHLNNFMQEQQEHITEDDDVDELVNKLPPTHIENPPTSFFGFNFLPKENNDFNPYFK